MSDVPWLVAGRDAIIWWDWVWRHTDTIWERSLQHLRLTLVAVGIGFAIALVLATLVLRYRRAYQPVIWATGLLYTIPSLALFAFLVPITGLGFVTAQIALVSYTLLILVRNIVAGVDAVPAAVKEAADGMGYSRWHRYVAVDLRLAVPTIIAGLRIASVTVVGLVTVAAVVGEGGYGVFILDGLNRRFSTPAVVGAVLSLTLAVVIDACLVLTERVLTPWTRVRGAT